MKVKACPVKSPLKKTSSQRVSENHQVRQTSKSNDNENRMCHKGVAVSKLKIKQETTRKGSDKKNYKNTSKMVINKKADAVSMAGSKRFIRSKGSQSNISGKVQRVHNKTVSKRSLHLEEETDVTFEEIERKIFEVQCDAEITTEFETSTRTDQVRRKNVAKQLSNMLDSPIIFNTKSGKTTSQTIIGNKTYAASAKVDKNSQKTRLKILNNLQKINKKLSMAETSISKPKTNEKFSDIEKMTFEAVEEKQRNSETETLTVKDSDHSKLLVNSPITKEVPEDSPMKLEKKLHNNESNNRLKMEDDLSDAENCDWEEVDELSQILSAKNEAASQDVKIELEYSSVLWGSKKRKRRTQQEQMEDYLRKSSNRNTKRTYEYQHKVHILCLVAYGRHVNHCLNTDEILACGLSLVRLETILPRKDDIVQIDELLTEFRKIMTYLPERLKQSDHTIPLTELLLQRYYNYIACSNRELVFMFVVLCRAVGLQARLVQNILPIHWKPPQSVLMKPKKDTGDTNKNKLEESKEEKCNTTTDIPIKAKKVTVRSRKSHCSKLLRNKKTLKGGSAAGSLNKDVESKRKVRQQIVTSDSDSEFSESSLKKKRKKPSKSQLKSLVPSSSPLHGSKLTKDDPAIMEWAEVYIKPDKKWITIDVLKKRIGSNGISSRLSPKSAYIVAYNIDGTMRDVTKRYVHNWLSMENKLRCDSDWWRDTLDPFIGTKTKRDEEEEKELDTNLRIQPLPKTIGEYKNHALYALQRHLLKFQAIYPHDESPVGFFREEPVFPRDSVKTLRGRDNWIREAKTVKVDEEPYKIVNAFPKWDRVNRVVIKDRPLELFGEWQIEDYVPPIAKDGKVPRNEYGNVDLFKSTMLPKGCSYIKVLGIQRVAKKLNIDCAAAVVGFEFGSQGCRPIIEGYVVCEESREILLDAWKEDQINQAEKQEEKRQKRIYGNWKRFINALLVKERIKIKYGCELDAEEEAKGVKKRAKKVTQYDLSELPNASTSKINLRVDTETSAAEITKRKLNEVNGMLKTATKRVKLSTKTPQNSQIAFNKFASGSLSSESDHEATENERKKKIQGILKWQPSCNRVALSDDSDDEKTVETKKIKRPLKSFKISKAVAPDADVKSSRQKCSRLRRRLSKRPTVTYNEQSDCDISFDDSDTDKSYIPKTDV